MYYATFVQRFIALIIDISLITPVALLFAYLMNTFIGGQYKYEFEVWFLLLSYVYFSVFETYTAGGQTLGKKLMNIGVTSNSYQRVNMVNTSLRFIGKLLLPIGFIFYFINRDKRCLHDLLANTRVIKK